MIEDLIKAVDALFLIDDTPSTRRQWRLLVALFILLFTFHVAWACGWLNAYGLGQGFVQGTQLEGVQRAIDLAASNAMDVKLKLMRKAIMDTRIQECKSESKRYFNQRLSEQLDEYYDLTKKVFNLPECSDLK